MCMVRRARLQTVQAVFLIGHIIAVSTATAQVRTTVTIDRAALAAPDSIWSKMLESGKVVQPLVDDLFTLPIRAARVRLIDAKPRAEEKDVVVRYVMYLDTMAVDRIDSLLQRIARQLPTTTSPPIAYPLTCFRYTALLSIDQDGASRSCKYGRHTWGDRYDGGICDPQRLTKALAVDQDRIGQLLIAGFGVNNGSGQDDQLFPISYWDDSELLGCWWNGRLWYNKFGAPDEGCAVESKLLLGRRVGDSVVYRATRIRHTSAIDLSRQVPFQTPTVRSRPGYGPALARWQKDRLSDSDDCEYEPSVLCYLRGAGNVVLLYNEKFLIRYFGTNPPNGEPSDFATGYIGWWFAPYRRLNHRPQQQASALVADLGLSDATHVNAFLVGGLGQTMSVALPIPFFLGADNLQIALEPPRRETQTVCWKEFAHNMGSIGNQPLPRSAPCEAMLASDLQRATGKRWKAVYPDWNRRWGSGPYQRFDMWEIIK